MYKLKLILDITLTYAVKNKYFNTIQLDLINLLALLY